MTMIGYFSRQAVQLRAGNRGQATALFLVVAATLLVVVFASIRLHHVAVARVSAANSVDAIALSAATWEARCLNLIAALNDGAIQCFRVIRWTCALWAALAVAAAFGFGAPAFAQYTREARRLIAGYWDTAHLLVSWSEKIRKAAPYLVLGEVAAMSSRRNVAGILFPLNPRGPHDGKNTLELHLAHGAPIHLMDAMAPISGVLNRLKRIRFLKGATKAVIALLEGALRGIVGTNKGPIRMLEPEKDFTDRQLVRFEGIHTVPDLPIPFLGEQGKRRVLEDATAQPYGGGSAEMTWGSRLIERGSK
ncbi:MAG: hypothetical protein D4R80_01025 [Deltaproteobacteria bacterium]|nr:MAG: hypothetical protein D4R80_01025 [Deltaproteobacteria bacterium]